MKRCLLDSSFVIDFWNETASRTFGPAHAWLRNNPSAELWISPVTYAETLEGADDLVSARDLFRSYRWQLIGRQQGERAALNQRRNASRLGENDAWQLAIAECMDASLVGHDSKAFSRLRDRYIDHRTPPPT